MSLPDKYVVRAEGTTDEMCLGTLLVTRPLSTQRLLRMRSPCGDP